MIATSTLVALLGGTITGLAGEPDTVKLEFYEVGAHREFEGLTGRTFRAAAALVEHYNGTDTQDLELSCPVVTGTPVVEYGYGSSYTAIAADQWEVREHPMLRIRNVLHLFTQLWGYGEGVYRVSYNGGYTAGAEPADVRDFVAELTRQRFLGRGPAVTASASTGSETDVTLPASLQAIVDRWRRPMGLVAHPLRRVS